jgi:hypothetical protein
MKIKGSLSILGFVGAMLASGESHALTIVLNRVNAGKSFPGSATNWSPVVAPDVAFMHPTPTSTLTADIRSLTVMRAAADYWQTVYTFSPNDVLTIYWGFLDRAQMGGSNVLAKARINTINGIGLITVGSIGLNKNPGGNPAANGWYVDTNPATWSEYPNGGVVHSTNIPYFGHPGRYVEDERFTDQNNSGVGDTLWQDMFTFVLHEMGHMLGMSTGLPRYNSQVSPDNDIDVTAPRPIPGLQWMSTGGHLTYSGQPQSLMFPTGQPGRRKWPSQGDISCIAQIEGWWVGSWGAGGGGVQGLAANEPPH